jgi:DNA-binding NtrC family response regulator
MHGRGNVRQLENAVFRSVVMCDGVELQPEDFPQIFSQSSRIEDALTLAASADEFLPVVNQPFYEEPAASGGALPLLTPLGEMRPMVEIEEEVIRRAIGHYGGQMSEVARRLGIGRSTLYRKLKEFGIEGGDEADVVDAA